MSYISKKTILLTSIIVLLFFVFLKLSHTLSFPDTNWLMQRENKIELEAEKPIIQKFKANRDNLARIEFLFGRSYLKSIGGNLKIQLADENCSIIISEKYLKISSLSLDDANDFIFPKIANSKDRIYCVKISFMPGAKNTPKKKPSVFINNNSKPENIYLFNSATNEELKNRSLSMRPAYKNNTIWQDATELNKRISQYKPWFLKQHYLSFIILLFIILSVALVVFLILNF